MTRKRSICVLIGDISHDYTNELMRGMNEAAAQQGIALFYMSGKQKHIASIDSDKEQEAIGYYNSIYDYAELISPDAYIISCGSLSGFTEDSHYRDFLRRFEGKNTLYCTTIWRKRRGGQSSWLTITAACAS